MFVVLLFYMNFSQEITFHSVTPASPMIANRSIYTIWMDCVFSITKQGKYFTWTKIPACPCKRCVSIHIFFLFYQRRRLEVAESYQHHQTPQHDEVVSPVW